MEASPQPEVLEAGELVIDPAARMALVEGRPLPLSVRELELLIALARRPGRVVSREELHAAVWGGRFRREDRSVDVYVHKLRVKLEEALPHWSFIHTHFGFGYRFAPEHSHLVHTPATARQQTRGAAMPASRGPTRSAKENP